eukprot:gene2282-2626_t
MDEKDQLELKINAPIQGHFFQSTLFLGTDGDSAQKVDKKTEPFAGAAARDWSKILSKLPLVTESIIDDHLIYKSSTMPDKKISQAYKHKEKGYKLFKEGYVGKLFVKANVNIRDEVQFLVKAKVTASMKQQQYNVYVHLLQENGEVSFANCNCKSGKGGCCKHVAAVLYTLWDYSKLGLKVVPDDLTCTQVAQKWSVPAQGAKQTSNAVYFEELTFEKADFKRDQSCSRKKALVKGIRKHFCATPEFAKEVKSDEIKDLAAALKGSGKCHLLVAALEGNNFKPCNTFQTSCRPLKIVKTNKMYQEDDPDNISDLSLRQIGFFTKFAGYTPLLGGRLLSAQCEQYFKKHLLLDLMKSEEIEHETKHQRGSKE